MELGGFSFGDTGVTMKRLIPLEEWEAPLTTVLHFQRTSPWWIGDLVTYGERAFGEEFYAATGSFGVSEDMVSRFAAVATKIPRNRRRAGLSWSHHREVTNLSPEWQIRVLKEAEESGWTSMQVRKYVQGLRRGVMRKP